MQLEVLPIESVDSTIESIDLDESLGIRDSMPIELRDSKTTDSPSNSRVLADEGIDSDHADGSPRIADVSENELCEYFLGFQTSNADCLALQGLSKIPLSRILM